MRLGMGMGFEESCFISFFALGLIKHSCIYCDVHTFIFWLTPAFIVTSIAIALSFILIFFPASIAQFYSYERRRSFGLDIGLSG
jgi:hypothetical protein